MIWLSCLKWRLFINAAGHDVSIIYLMRLYVIGYFFNIFTPSNVGGDVCRSLHLGKELNDQRTAFTSTFLERFTGLFAMAILGLAFVVLGEKATTGIELSIMLIAGFTSIIALLCFSELASALAFRSLYLILEGGAERTIFRRLRNWTAKLEQAMSYAREKKSLFGKAMILSFLFHLSAVANTYLAARAIGWQNPDFAALFVVVPLVLIVSMLPLTPSGIGIQEGAFLFFLQRIGATRAEALSVGFILRAKVLLIAFLGWGLWLFYSRSKHHGESSVEV